MSQTASATTVPAATAAQVGHAALVEARDALVVAANHELRTPLTSIIAVCELLLDGDAGALNEEQRAMLTVAVRNGDRLRSLVEELVSGTSDALDVALSSGPARGAACGQAPRRTARGPRRLHPVVVPLRDPVGGP